MPRKRDRNPGRGNDRNDGVEGRPRVRPFRIGPADISLDIHRRRNRAPQWRQWIA
jgi:hypothetical protein